MSLNKVSPGENAPEIINVIIEIPAHSGPVKYEVDKDTGTMYVDRIMRSAMFYPCNYGYVPNTLADDGDPVDVLVITPVPLLSGSVIPARPVGVLNMEDESGGDVKILAVPSDKLTPNYHHIKTPKDVSPHTLEMITHFFEHYKDLEPNKWVKIDGWLGPDEAKTEIMASIERFQ